MKRAGTTTKLLRFMSKEGKFDELTAKRFLYKLKAKL